MPKKMKFLLNDLKVESFVTSPNQIFGGLKIGNSNNVCNTQATCHTIEGYCTQTQAVGCQSASCATQVTDCGSGCVTSSGAPMVCD
jgi:hypothetical protein